MKFRTDFEFSLFGRVFSGGFMVLERGDFEAEKSKSDAVGVISKSDAGKLKVGFTAERNA